MDVLNAPLYPPAAAFEMPVAAPFQGRLSDFSVAELMKMTAVWELTVTRFPKLREIVVNPKVVPPLALAGLATVNMFLPFATKEELAALDAELQRHPSFQISAP